MFGMCDGINGKDNDRADDDEGMFVVMEKARLIVYNGLEAEEPVSCTGYVCGVSEMSFKVAMMDEVFADPEGSPRNAVTIVEVKRLSDVKAALSENGVNEAVGMVESSPHPRKLIADASLGCLDLDMAQKAFVRNLDYSGLLL
jgi:WD repeat-containing protein 35